MGRWIERLVVPMLFCAQWAAAAEPPPGPCVTDPGFADFDFWVGEWTVTDRSDGSHAGVNRIRKIDGGCALLEEWRGREGGTGTSLNYYNPVTKRWRQVWVASGHYSLMIEGGIEEGAMAMAGEILYYRSGALHRFRGTWTPNGDGTVRQHFQQYDDEKGAWQEWFDGLYVRAAPPQSP